MFQHIEIDLQDRIAILSLNRPQALNALNASLLQELVQACAHLNEQKQIRVVIIRGRGKNFSAGADLAEATNFTPDQGDWMERREIGQMGYRMCQAVENLQAVSIAQVHGFAIGGALLLMLACDFRLVEKTAFFSIPEVDLGIPLSWGGIPKLVAEVGPLKARELVMSCRRFSAKEALELGIVNQLLEKEHLAEEALKLAKSLAEKPALPLRITKEQIRACSRQIATAYVSSAEGDVLMSILKDKEFQEAAQAYLTKLKKE